LDYTCNARLWLFRKPKAIYWNEINDGFESGRMTDNGQRVCNSEGPREAHARRGMPLTGGYTKTCKSVLKIRATSIGTSCQRAPLRAAQHRLVAHGALVDVVVKLLSSPIALSPRCPDTLRVICVSYVWMQPGGLVCLV
jgi:hypothetical protein